jgi:hypothetical protein
MFQPLMNRYHQKIIQYARGLERINELIIRSLAVKEPEMLIWDPSRNVKLKTGQVDRLDPNDPLTYQTYVHFPQPLPLDKLIALNEVQSMLSLGLESKEGALRSLGESFPTDKLNEIRQELMDDAVADGALKLLQTQIEQEIAELTGTMPNPETGGKPGQPLEPGVAAGAPAVLPSTIDEALAAADMGEADLRNKLVTEAYGTVLPQRRVPEEYEK